MYLVTTAKTMLADHWRRRLGVQVTTIDENLVVAEARGPAPDPLPRIRRVLAKAAELPSRPRASIPRALLGRGDRGEDGHQRGQRPRGAIPGTAARRRAWPGGGRMNRRIRRVSRWIDDLLRDRRPRRHGAQLRYRVGTRIPHQSRRRDRCALRRAHTSDVCSSSTSRPDGWTVPAIAPHSGSTATCSSSTCRTRWRRCRGWNRVFARARSRCSPSEHPLPEVPRTAALESRRARGA
jgi:hypothetical protein